MLTVCRHLNSRAQFVGCRHLLNPKSHKSATSLRLVLCAEVKDHDFIMVGRKILKLFENWLSACTKIKKTYDTPKTPYQRLLESHALTTKQKAQLKEEFKTKNPFYLKEQLETRLKVFSDLLDERKRLHQLRTG